MIDTYSPTITLPSAEDNPFQPNRAMLRRSPVRATRLKSSALSVTKKRGRIELDEDRGQQLAVRTFLEVELDLARAGDAGVLEHMVIGHQQPRRDEESCPERAALRRADMDAYHGPRRAQPELEVPDAHQVAFAEDALQHRDGWHRRSGSADADPLGLDHLSRQVLHARLDAFRSVGLEDGAGADLGLALEADRLALREAGFCFLDEVGGDHDATLPFYESSRGLKIAAWTSAGSLLNAWWRVGKGTKIVRPGEIAA